jgi:hypothetical protein
MAPPTHGPRKKPTLWPVASSASLGAWDGRDRVLIPLLHSPGVSLSGVENVGHVISWGDSDTSILAEGRIAHGAHMQVLSQIFI